ncbi:unnamed protein product, partial [Allacma fusca]
NSVVTGRAIIRSIDCSVCTIFHQNQWITELINTSVP